MSIEPPFLVRRRRARRIVRRLLRWLRELERLEPRRVPALILERERCCDDPAHEHRVVVIPESAAPRVIHPERKWMIAAACFAEVVLRL
jgi:hypothetical protein